MATRRFVNIAFAFENDPDYTEIQKVLDKAVDWVQYAPNCWLVWTSSSPKRWYGRLKEHLNEGDHLFICEINIEERSGWMPKAFWDFIRSYQKSLSED
jgi:hypothetical protein